MISTPLGVIEGPRQFSQGTISGLGRTVNVEGRALTGLMQTDAPLSPGNSGGPVLLLNGTVVGLVDAGDTSAQGISYAVPAMSAGPLFSTWRGDPSPQLPATCPATTPSGTTPPATIPSNEFYPGADFSIDYPTGWVVTHLQLSGGNLDTTFQPPGASRVEPFIRVDENPVDNSP